MESFYQYQPGDRLLECDARMDERAFAYGDGFFSTMGVHDGRLIGASFHKIRISQGAAAFALTIDIDDLMSRLVTEARQVGEGIIKIIITRPIQSVRGYGFFGDELAQAYIKVMPSSLYQGVRIQDGIPIQPPMPHAMALMHGKLGHRPPALAGLKLIGCAEQVMIHAELLARQRLDDEIGDGLVSNVHGEWVSAVMANVFYRLEDRWYTPPVDRSGVAGVMRAAVMASGILGEVHQRVLIDADLLKISSLITTNAVRGITAITSLDGRSLDVF